MRDELMLLLEIQEANKPDDVVRIIKKFISNKLEENPTEDCLRNFIKIFPICIPYIERHGVQYIDMIEYRKTSKNKINILGNIKILYETASIVIPYTYNIDTVVKGVAW